MPSPVMLPWSHRALSAHRLGGPVKKLFMLVSNFALLFSLTAVAQEKEQDKEKKPDEKAAAAPRGLSVKLSYKGDGKVDDQHKILVFFFDSPDFTQGTVMPFS